MTEFWSAWNWNPLIGGMLAFLGWRYMDGVWRLWQRAGKGRGIKEWRVYTFWCGMLALFVALISPIDTWGHSSLAIHMIQHLLLMLVAAPLLVLGLPANALISMIPRLWRQRLVRWWHHTHLLRPLTNWFTKPVVAWGIYALVLWVWHAPPLYQSALESSAVHILEHASFTGAGLLFWWAILRRVELGIFLIFTTAVHSSLFGALMTFSSQTWYPAYRSLEDQQLAGLLMWMPGGVIYAIAAVLLLWHWLNKMEKRDAKLMA